MARTNLGAPVAVVPVVDGRLPVDGESEGGLGVGGMAGWRGLWMCQFILLICLIFGGGMGKPSRPDDSGPIPIAMIETLGGSNAYTYTHNHHPLTSFTPV